MRKILIFLLALIALGESGICPPALAASAKKQAATQSKPDPSSAFFASSEVPRFTIEIAEPELDKLRRQQGAFGNPGGGRDWALATVRVDGTVYRNVALHLKGAAGSFRSVDDRPAMTLSLDRYVPGQNFHGMEKLSLNNSVQDESYASEAICRETFLKAGIPTPRAAHAQVTLNGRDLGLYVLTEGWDKRFIERHFPGSRGRLYDGGFLKDIDTDLAVNVGKEGKQEDRLSLLAAARESNLANRLAQLEKILDVDRFLTYAALEVMLWDWDGYPMNRNNWRLYHDTRTQKFVFLPHGLDQMFWKPKGSVFPPLQGLVARAVLEIPSCRERYFARMKELRQTVFDPGAMTNRIAQLTAKIQPALAAKGGGAAEQQRKAAQTLAGAIETRALSLDQQLDHPIELPRFDAEGWTRLTGWRSKAEFGHPALQKEIPEGIRETITVGTERGSSIGSWRTSMWLNQGRYRVEGRLKTQGITPDTGDPRAGAGIRTSTNRPQGYTTGTTAWGPVNCEFDIRDPLAEVELICDFRGAEGKAWFDLESLRLKKLSP